MAILYGTTGDGTTLPVLVDQFGNLLAKGIEGEPGTPGAPGAPGEPGAPGGAFPLPPDPYEGAFLGWLDDELAWIGIPPVPIAEGVFGPITNWEPGGLLTVEGEIPEQIKTGVFIYQCNEDGTIYVDGWNNSQVWSSRSVITGPINNGSTSSVFRGITEGALEGGLSMRTGAVITFNMPSSLFTETNNSLLFGGGESINLNIEVKYDSTTLTNSDAAYTNAGNNSTYVFSIPQNKDVQFKVTSKNSSAWINMFIVNNVLLVDAGDYPTAPNLNFRVQSVNLQNLIGVANRTNDFTPGKYLRVPEQKVARWLYDGNLNKVITSTGIDISRLTGN